MIVSRTPCRLCLVGGGTDVRDFYAHDHGAVVTVTLATSMYVTVGRRRDGLVGAGGGGAGTALPAEQVAHDFVREALAATGVAGGVDIGLYGEIADGTGLASSSAQLVGLLHALAAHREAERRGGRVAWADGVPGRAVAPRQLAEQACTIEIARLAANTGKLDPFSTAIGGLLYMRFDSDETTTCRPIEATPEALCRLEGQMMLFDTGHVRQASTIMAGWRRSMDAKRPVLRQMRDQAAEVAELLERGDVDALGPVLDHAWRLKKRIAEGISLPAIDKMYAAAMAAGATGGKLSGAGGGGYLLLLCPPARQAAVRQALAAHPELTVRLDPRGSRIVLVDR